MRMTIEPQGSYRLIESPFGLFAIIERDDGRLEATWAAIDDRRLLDRLTEDPELQPELARRLERYFAGEPADFSEVPTPDGPDFYRRCWDACRAIPAGQVISYGKLAKMAGGDGRASRAAGQSMRRNPLPVIVPCHRVVASTGRLHGYGGSCCGEQLDIKQGLLRLEGAIRVETALIPGDPPGR